MGDAFAQGQEPEGFGIAQPVHFEGFAGPLARGFGGGRGGLTNLHMDDVLACGGTRICLTHHVHDAERIDAAAAGHPPRQAAGFLPVEAKLMRNYRLAFS